MLQSSTWLLSKKCGIKGLKTGQYGKPPSVTYWVRQAAVYVFSLTTMKLLVVALFAFWPGVSTIGDWLLGWTTLWDGESVQVILYVHPSCLVGNALRKISSVMGVFPMIMNIVQFWLIDSIVKASTNSIAVLSASSRNSDSQDREPLFNSSDDEDEVLPRDIEDGPLSSTSRSTSGDFKTLVGAEENRTKLFTSGSSSQMTLPRTPLVVAHDYPPNNVGSVSSQSSTRSRHKYTRASSSLLDFPVTYSSLPVNTLDSSRPALPSMSLDGSEATTDGVAEFDAWERDYWEEGEGQSGRRSEQGMNQVGVR